MNHESSERLRQTDERRRKLLACIDRVLSKLGPDVRRALIYHMRRKYDLKRHEIPDKPGEFSLALRQVFGKSASGIEQGITEIIVSEFHLGPKMKLNFIKAVRTVLSKKD